MNNANSNRDLVGLAVRRQARIALASLRQRPAFAEVQCPAAICLLLGCGCKHPEPGISPTRSHRALITIALLALAMAGNGCRTVDVRSTADSETDFSRFHTFNFAEPSTSTNHPHLTALNRQRVQSAVVAQMAKRSCRLADQPDLLFAIDLQTSTQTYDRSNPTVESGSLGANLNKQYGLMYDKNAGSQPVVDYTQGTLSFRALEAAQNRPVWEGLAVGVLYQDRPDDLVQKRIHDVVEAVFAKFPIKPQPR